MHYYIWKSIELVDLTRVLKDDENAIFDPSEPFLDIPIYIYILKN